MESVSWFEPDVFAVGVLGLGGMLTGLLEIAAQASRRKHRWSILAASFAATLAVFAAGAFQLGQASRIWVPPLALASLGFALRVARSAWFPSLEHFLLSLARSRRVQWGTLLLVGPCAGFAWTYHVEQVCGPANDELANLIDPFDRSDLHELDPSPAFTDVGRPVRLFVLTKTSQSIVKLLEHEETLVDRPGLARRLIRAAPADPASNCFGWVFAQGRYWIRDSKVVETILQDNGYHEISAPGVGDLAIYRDEQGRISHVGIVRAAPEDGPLLIESKWSWMSRFIHGPGDQLYGAKCTYYHTARRSHLLHGLEGDSLPPPASALD